MEWIAVGFLKIFWGIPVNAKLGWADCRVNGVSRGGLFLN
jgi:hypothetical protein